jgi:hypothetical protein
MKPVSKVHIAQRIVTAAALLLVVVWPIPAQNGARDEPTAIEFTVKRGNARTRVKMFVERGVITRVVATNAAGSRTIPLAKAGTKIALACEENKICQTIRLESGQTIKVCICKQDGTALLVPAVQKVREIGSGGSRCTEPNPCCWEDHDLQMSICHP